MCALEGFLCTRVQSLHLGFTDKNELISCGFLAKLSPLQGLFYVARDKVVVVVVYVAHFLLIVENIYLALKMPHKPLFPVGWQGFEDFPKCRTKNRNCMRWGEDPFGTNWRCISRNRRFTQTSRGIFTVCWIMTQLVAIFHYDGLSCWLCFCVGSISGFTSLSLWLVLLLWTVELGWRGGGCCCGESLHAVDDGLPDSGWPWLIVSPSLCSYPVSSVTVLAQQGCSHKSKCGSKFQFHSCIKNLHFRFPLLHIKRQKNSLLLNVLHVSFMDEFLCNQKTLLIVATVLVVLQGLSLPCIFKTIINIGNWLFLVDVKN